MSLSVKDVDFGEQNIIYVTAVSDKEKYGVEWTVPATECLLQYMKTYIKLFANGKLRTKKQLYENISAAMEEKGLFYSTTQCENKWKSLKRSYMTRYEKSHSSRRFPFTKGPYESQIEDILKVERPSLKKEIELYNTVNLNVPPGFSKTEPISEGEEDQIHMYTEKDEELVRMVLREPDPEDNDSKDNVGTHSYEYGSPASDNDEHNYSYTKNLENKKSIRLVEEITELKKIVKRNLDANTEVLRNHNATHEQIMTYLDTLEKREEEKLEIKRQKLDKQDELIHQLKIQNSLIAKFIQKLGNK